jgi:hypothetical protein
MADRTTRLSVLVLAVLIFVVMWATVSAKPWAASKRDARLTALAQRERSLRADARLVRRIVATRAAQYRAALARRNALSASSQAAPATPSVRVVNLPPLTITKTS